MKIAVLSDIHGNYHALKAVLRHASLRGAGQMVLNLGDSVGYGPDPEAIIRWSQGAHVINLQGDYDKKVLSKKHRQVQWSGVSNPDKRKMFSWTYHALSKQARKTLKSYPKEKAVVIEGLKILMTHTGTGSHHEYLGPETPDNELIELTNNVAADIILCGHSHRGFVRHVKNTMIINPGSVGRPDDGDPRASYAILEIRDKEPAVHLFRVAYNLTNVVHAVRQTGLPEIFSQVLQQGLNYDEVAAKLGNPPAISSLETSGILTLLTDFGLADHFIGVMKGVINEIAPQAKIIDISHQIRPQNVLQGASMLAESVYYFSPGTVHVAVIDPGVGTARRAIAARIGWHYFVTPDNGLLTFVYRKAKANNVPIVFVELNQPEYWLPNPSRTFHGRDIFAPVGAHLINGLPLENLGEIIHDPQWLEPPQPQITSEGWLAEVVMVDVFGNLSTNLSAEVLEEPHAVNVEIKGKTIDGLTSTFGDEKQGSLIATIDSTGVLAIAVVNGSAKDQLNADIGTPVKITVRN